MKSKGDLTSINGHKGNPTVILREAGSSTQAVDFVMSTFILTLGDAVDSKCTNVAGSLYLNQPHE